MAGAAILASVAALHSGAGRVYACLLDTAFGLNATAQYPALMVRDVNSLQLEKASIVCGCGGGDEVRAILPKILSASAQLVLDADALNAIAREINQPKIERRHGIALISGQFVIFHSFAKVAVCAFALIRKNSNIILAFRIARSCSL